MWGIEKLWSTPERGGREVTTAWHEPYVEPRANRLYNRLFCDDGGVFRSRDLDGRSAWTELVATETDPQALLAIARSDEPPSRVRALACQRLREAGAHVPSGLLLGVVVERSLESGLETVGAHADGSVWYIDSRGATAIFDGAPADVRGLALQLLACCESLIPRLEPWIELRPSSPRIGNTRVTLLTSEGLHFDEGRTAILEGDPYRGPVAFGAHLLRLAVEVTLAENEPTQASGPAERERIALPEAPRPGPTRRLPWPAGDVNLALLRSY